MKGLIWLAKISINYCLKTNGSMIEKNILGLKNKNNIIYKDTDYITNLHLLDNQIIMERTNNAATLKILLGNINDCTYYIKDYNKNFKLDIRLIKLKIDRDKVYFKYELNDEIREFRLTYEVI